VNVGEDFDALFLVGGDELVKGIVSLAEVSAFSLATTLPTAPIPDSVPNIEDPAWPVSLGAGQMLWQVLRQRKDLLSDSTALLDDNLPIPQYRRFAHQHHAHALSDLVAELLRDTAIGIAVIAFGSIGEREHLQ